MSSEEEESEPDGWSSSHRTSLKVLDDDDESEDEDEDEDEDEQPKGYSEQKQQKFKKLVVKEEIDDD